MIFISTTESSGIDRYSQELGKLLPVNIMQTRRYQSGLRALAFFRESGVFKEPVHYTNQHFGRVAILSTLPFIVTVHDLERMCFPFSRNSFGESIGLKLDALAIKKARHVIAVSENTRQDLMRYLGISAAKITVIYNGVDHQKFRPNGSTASEFPYLLYVGSERPRKNLRRLINVFAEIKKLPQFGDLKLVKVGKPGRSPALRQNTLNMVKQAGLEGEVIFSEQVEDKSLQAFYSSARALVYPSLYEGFGLPVLEAMACGCPVITSNVSSLPEVSGDATLLIDPYSEHALYHAILRILSDLALRNHLISRGLERASHFSWENAAEATLEVYQRTGMPLKL